MESYQYPIGRFSYEGEITMGQIHMWIEDIEAMPEKLRHAVEGLSKEQLDTPYRPEGWTVRQVVHHLADSHMNAFIRFKLALTEDTPAIKHTTKTAGQSWPIPRTTTSSPRLPFWIRFTGAGSSC